MLEMSVDEAAASLGVTNRTLNTQIHKGRLKARRLGRMWLIDPTEVERYRTTYLGRIGGPRPDAVTRFWSYVEKTDGCWLWKGQSRDGRYGSHWAGNRYQSAHRFSYELHSGPLAEGKEVCHTCDNGLCVRPDHLEPGTHAENQAGMAARGRSPAGANHPRARTARITDDMVRDIRWRYAGGESQVSLAEEFGVSQHYVSRIISGERRGHVSDHPSCTCPLIPANAIDYCFDHFLMACHFEGTTTVDGHVIEATPGVCPPCQRKLGS
jgi:excisionase family DNA binding protein